LITRPSPGFQGVEILGLLDIVLEIVAVLVAVLVGVRLGVRSSEAAIGLGQAAIRAARRRQAQEPAHNPPEWPVDWPLALTLFVRVDEGEGVLQPSVQIRGAGQPRRARLRLELVDPGEEVRVTLKRAFPAEALNTQLPFPRFAPPAGASLDEVLRWRWDIVLSGERSELRWRERPEPAEGLNPEAELRRTERAPVEPMLRRLPEGEGASGLDLERARHRVVLRKRAARLLLAIALVAYIIVVVPGPTGEISVIRAILLYGAVAAIPVALGALAQALFATDAELAPDGGSAS
jgi:hypothetical protein